MGLKEENLRIMQKYGIKAQKKYGQNFLINEEILDKILKSADIKNEDLVIEIGPGLGNLTCRLCEKASQVIAIEIDREMVNILSNEYANLSNLKIVNMDILECDLSELIKEYKLKKVKKVKVVANLPYYITTPIIMKLLEEEYDIDLIEVMVQKEVADRLCAKPGGRDFGAITLSINYYTDAYYITTVPAADFFPSPNVDSAVVQMVTRKNKIEVVDTKLMFSIIKAAFSMRRKTLLNSLGTAKILGVDKSILEGILTKLSIPLNIRAEGLSIDDFNKITNEYFNFAKDKSV